MSKPTLPEMLAEYRAGLTDFVAPVAAEKFLADLDAKGRRVVDDWLRSQAVHLIAQMLVQIDGRERSRARSRSGPRAFAQAVAAAEAGDDAPLSVFATYFVVNEDNLRRRVGDMTGADHKFVAAAYSVTSNRAALLAQFHAAIARKVGHRTTAEVMDEATYLELHDSITGRTTPTGSRAKAA